MNQNIVFAIVLLGFLAACALTQVVKPTIPQSEQECLAMDGDWQHIGLPGTPKRCDLKANDGGKKCTDSLQCQGKCMAPQDVQEGYKTNGVCSAYILNFGCARRVEKGYVGVEICVD